MIKRDTKPSWGGVLHAALLSAHEACSWWASYPKFILKKVINHTMFISESYFLCITAKLLSWFNIKITKDFLALAINSRT